MASDLQKGTFPAALYSSCTHSIIYLDAKCAALDLVQKSDATDQQLLNANDDCNDIYQVWSLEM